MSLTTFLGTCSSPLIVELLEPLMPHQEVVLRNIQVLLEDPKRSLIQRRIALKKVCGDEVYARFKLRITAICDFVDFDLNAPIFYNIIHRSGIEVPAGYSFEDLAVWLYCHHRALWDLIQARKFAQTSARCVHEYQLEPALFKAAGYEDPEAIERFQTATSAACRGLGFGDHVYLLSDSEPDEAFYRAVIFLSPIDQQVMTFKDEFRLAQDMNTTSLVLSYDKRLQRLFLIGRKIERSVAFQIAAAWAECFLGMNCTAVDRKKCYNLQCFQSIPIALETNHPMIASMHIKSVLIGDNVLGDTMILSPKDEPHIRPEQVHATLKLFPSKAVVKRVSLRVTLTQRYHNFTHVDVSLSTKSLTFGEAGNCEDLRQAIKAILRKHHVLPQGL